jgi:hypothetical protein
MLKNQYLKQWSLVVSEKMPHLSLPQAIGLATWSFGVAITQSSSLSRISGSTTKAIIAFRHNRHGNP